MKSFTVIAGALVVVAGIGYGVTAAQQKPSAGTPSVTVFKSPT